MEKTLDIKEIEEKIDTSLEEDSIATVNDPSYAKPLARSPFNVERWWATNVLKGLHPVINGHTLSSIPNLTVTVLHVLNILFPYHKLVFLLLKGLYFVVLKNIYFVLSLVISAAISPRLKDGLKSSSLILSFALFSISSFARPPPPREKVVPAPFSKEVQKVSGMLIDILQNVKQEDLILEGLKPNKPHPLHASILSGVIVIQLAYFLRRKKGPLYNVLSK